MSMHPEQDNFQDLRRLLALKRHEQPPPGYFDGFSRQVIARLRAGERPQEGSLWEQVSGRLQQLWAALEQKPVLAGAFGAAVCGLLVTGVVFSEQLEPGSVATLTGAESAPAPMQVATRPAASALFEPVAASSTVSSTDGAVSLENHSSLFQEFKETQKPWLQPVGFSPAHNN